MTFFNQFHKEVTERKMRKIAESTQLGDGQPHVGPFEIEQRITESFAKEHGLWIPIDSVFDLGTPGPSVLDPLFH